MALALKRAAGWELGIFFVERAMRQCELRQELSDGQQAEQRGQLRGEMGGKRYRADEAEEPGMS